MPLWDSISSLGCDMLRLFHLLWILYSVYSITCTVFWFYCIIFCLYKCLKFLEFLFIDKTILICCSVLCPTNINFSPAIIKIPFTQIQMQVSDWEVKRDGKILQTVQFIDENGSSTRVRVYITDRTMTCIHSTLKIPLKYSNP